MKSNKKKILILIVLGIVFTISTVSTHNFSDDQRTYNRSMEILNEPHLKSPKISGYWTTDLIHIQNDNWSATLLPWIQVGLGTKANPHIIENVTINAGYTRSCILIEDSHEHFIIRNCTVYNAGHGAYDAGIKLVNTSNGTLTNNDCSNNGGIGIHLFNNCDNNTISENTVNYNFQGIWLRDFCNDNIISGNTVSYAEYGIELGECDNNIISGNTAYYNWQAIILSNSDNNTISGNNVDHNQYSGIWLMSYSDNNIVSENTANDNIGTGIALEWDCDNNTISNNTANDNWRGIYLRGSCDSNTVSGNTINDISFNGISLEDSSDNNIISRNLIKNNQNTGIYIETYCWDNLIYQNSLLGTGGSHGRDYGFNNKWDNGTIGNYWDNHTSPDSDNDGIVDTSYTWITGSAGSEDSFPLRYSPVFLQMKFILMIPVLMLLIGPEQLN